MADPEKKEKKSLSERIKDAQNARESFPSGYDRGVYSGLKGPFSRKVDELLTEALPEYVKEGKGHKGYEKGYEDAAKAREYKAKQPPKNTKSKIAEAAEEMQNKRKKKYGGKIKMKHGGSVKAHRGDGICKKGKTRGRMV
jgi:hypothetical protein